LLRLCACVCKTCLSWSCFAAAKPEEAAAEVAATANRLCELVNSNKEEAAGC